MEEIYDAGSGPVGQVKTVIWIGDTPEKHIAYAAWRDHVRDCEGCSRDGGCGTEAELWALYRRMVAA
jgi:hypothetical protein